ncbi:MAG: glycosyltransferase [Clostridia bacterium]|nr:glycosyltransferase [Clostridia bacterium]
MTLNINVLILVVLGLLYIAIMVILKMIIHKFSSLDDLLRRNHKRMTFVLSLLKHEVKGSFDNLMEIKAVKENLILEDQTVFDNVAGIGKVVDEEIRHLNKGSVLRKKEACTYLGLVGTEKARRALEEALMTEEDYSVKVYISNALTDIRQEASLECMIEALIGSKKWYREKAISNILDFGHAFHVHFLRLQETRDIEHVELLIKYARVSFNHDTKAYLFNFVDNFEGIREKLKLYYQFKNENGQTAYKADYVLQDMNGLLEMTCRILADYYPREFQQEKYHTHAYEIIQRNALWALSKTNSTENFKILMGFFKDERHEKTVIGALTRMVSENPRFLYLLEDALESEVAYVVRNRMAQVLSNRIEYYILKLNGKGGHRAEKILVEILNSRKINELIGFLNVNQDVDIENRLLEIIRKQVDPESDIGEEFRIYLAPRLVEKLQMTVLDNNLKGEVHQRDRALIAASMAFLLVTSLFFPVLFFMQHFDMYQAGAYRQMVKEFVISFNYLLAYYSLSINGVYIGLLVMSYKNVRKQARLWRIKNISMLFREKMLPSISIIAPAYNEEKTVVESARSLLNLNYPDYEVIIVNDGSQDETLLSLIKAFNLVRVDYQYRESLQTSPIRGIYRNPSLPRMLVVDKSNGGKADALNAGINVANKIYFCGIDSDSLLEPDALLKISSLTLDESLETPALGGNICPINGCKVDKGLVSEVRVPKNSLARFQTIEYMRAFMAGRLGWQELNSLLIISGAFGLFRKDRIIGIGGYMTQKGQYKKDTVGEDMELVVRISRLMHESGNPFKVLYAFNANCWTEVPEDMKSLRNQRFRWHRGLIDILYFHRKMLFNKHYGNTGMVAMPYFFIFEAIGPIIEFQGYIMVVLAAILGILDRNIAILLFISTILLGVIVSISSLLIAERESHYFKLRDLLKLLLYAVIENFGIRQLFGFWRIRGLVRIVFGKGGWGHIQRQGVRP